MSDHSEDVSKHIRGYLIIGGTLIIGTILTVLASYVDLGMCLLDLIEQNDPIRTPADCFR
jgi:hypothetical protein